MPSRRPRTSPSASSDSILDDLLGLNRHVVVAEGERIEFRRRGELTTLERHRMTVLQRRRLELHGLLFGTDAGAEAGEAAAEGIAAACVDYDRIQEEIAGIVLVGEWGKLKPFQLDLLLDLFFQCSARQAAAETEAFKSTLSRLVPEPPPAAEGPSATGSTSP